MKTLTPWFRKSLPVQKRDEEYPLYSLQREMNALFNDFFRGFEISPFQPNEELFGEYIPQLDMHEDEKSVVVSAELPGLDEKDVTVSISKDLLTISGEKRSEKKEDAKGHYKMERVYGSFKRSIMLPVEIDRDRSEATFKNGVLTVTLPKTAESQTAIKTIAVKKV